MRRLAPAALPSRDGADLGFGNLRLACMAAMVPLRDVDGWALPGSQVTVAVGAARDGASLVGGVEGLRDAFDGGALALGSRLVAGRPLDSELLVLASVLRSPVADEAMP